MLGRTILGGLLGQAEVPIDDRDRELRGSEARELDVPLDLVFRGIFEVVDGNELRLAEAVLETREPVCPFFLKVATLSESAFLKEDCVRGRLPLLEVAR